MTRTKRNTLPKDFEALLTAGNLDKLTSVFDDCDVNAHGGYAKQTALAFEECPDALARWLVANGADLSARDTHGNTPLHTRARHWRADIAALIELGANVNDAGASIGTPLHAAADGYRVDKVKLLLAHGADVDARGPGGLTALELALRGCANAHLVDMAELADVLLAAGAARTQRMSGWVANLGRQFEFHRNNFAEDRREAASAALARLYTLLDVAPVAPRVTHDGKSPITVGPGKWTDRHEALWSLLVPSTGPAGTVQGEVIRISGRICHELDGNGGGNWDADYRRMADAFLEYVGRGNALDAADLAALAELVEQIKQKNGSPARMAELAVAWVARNPEPIALLPPGYRR
jgi:hypothetical protein